MRRTHLATDRGLAWFVLASLLLHGLVLFGSRMAADKKRMITPAYNVKLVSSRPSGGRSSTLAPGLDAVSPPVPTPPQAPTIEPAPKPVARSTVPTTLPQKPSPKTSERKSVLKTTEKLQGKAQEKTVSSAPTSKDAKIAKPQDFESALSSVEKILRNKAGQTVTPNSRTGSSTAGGVEFAGGLGGRQAAALAIQIYAGQVQQAIQKHWAVPTSIARAQATVEIGIKVDARGQILDAWIEQTSGIPIFDESALRAVRAANPLPAPPMIEGGTFEFYSRFTPRGAASP